MPTGAAASTITTLPPAAALANPVEREWLSTPPRRLVLVEGYNGALVAIIFFGTILLLFLYYGFRCLRERPRRQAQIVNDRLVAERLQNELDAEEREQRRMNKRSNRLAKLQEALDAYTMVVKDEDLVLGVDVERGNGISTAQEHFSMDDGVVDETLALPPGNEEECEKSRQHVASFCSVCLTAYEAGDVVIWSPNRQCKHAYHKECILEWLTKGKKRCPCCRYNFTEAPSEDSELTVDDGSCDPPSPSPSTNDLIGMQPLPISTDDGDSDQLRTLTREDQGNETESTAETIEDVEDGSPVPSPAGQAVATDHDGQYELHQEN